MGFLTKDSKPPVAPRPAKPRTYSTIRPITASGQRINTNNIKELEEIADRKRTATWQSDSWEYFDVIGEIQYAYTVFSNVLSRIRLHAAWVEDDQDSPGPLKDSNASEFAKTETAKAMRRVFGNGNQSQILRKAGLNLLVAGECFLVCENKLIDGRYKEIWRIVSTDELVTTDRGLAIKKNRDVRQTDLVPLPPSTFVGRIWREHPRFSDEAVSAMKSLCGLCNELLLISRTVRATARSRLNAGVFFIPEEFSVSSDAPTDTEADPEEDLESYVEDEDEEFEEALIDLMGTPIADEESVMSLVPLIIRGPADLGDKLRHITFARPFDEQLVAQGNRTLDRILQGLDMPKEMITGLADIKYSNAIQINESFYTAHIEPLVLMLCDTFRIVYLEPALIKAGVDQEEIDNIVIWYDPSGIITAPDKSAAANVGYDKFTLSGAAWRRANGFGDDDAPSRSEVIERIAINRGVLTPELTDLLFRKLDPDLMDEVRQNTLANQGSPMPDSVQNLLDPNSAQAPPNTPGETAPTGTEQTPTPEEAAGEDTTDSPDTDVDPDSLPTPEELLNQ